MIKIKKGYIFLGLLFLLLVGIRIEVQANESIGLEVNRTQIEKEEEIEMVMKIKNAQIASGTWRIYFDNTKLEYEKGPENSNFVDSTIVYTWVKEDGGSMQNDAHAREEDEVIFTLKAKEEGITNVVIVTEAYDANGKQLLIDDEIIQITIGDIQEQNNQAEIVSSTEEQPEEGIDSSYLKILRTGQEGINPIFQREITQYYLIVDSSVSKIPITAIPESSNATVSITGNENLKEGLNIIEIVVTSLDQEKQTKYSIYVTKTQNQETANANLENLAVRQAMLYPSFDYNVTNYQIEIEPTINEIDILAVPQSYQANVTITGNTNLQEGNNLIKILVTAENKITTKEYHIHAYKRTQEEQTKYEEEKKIETQRLSTLLENTNEILSEAEKKEAEENGKMQGSSLLFWVSAVICLLLASVVGYRIWKRQKEN